ncbi:MAG: diacylglycerol/lipid kinase family protein [Thermoleophilia bacterium]
MKIPLIYNPAAGSCGERRAMKIATALESYGAVVVPMGTKARGDATVLARKAADSGAGRIVVAGGDGTINEVVNGMAGRDIDLAVIPVGTVNVLAKALSIPSHVNDACRLAVRGESIPLDLGIAGDRYFTLMAGVGFDALTIKNLDPVLKRALRHAAFPISGIKTLVTEELPLIKVKGGGHETEGYFVVAANSRYYGGRFGPTPLAHMQDGLLDFCVLKEKSFTEMIRFWVSALLKEQLDEPLAEYFRSDMAEINCPSGKPVLVQTDGEIVGELPVKIGLIPGGLRVCAGIGS